MNKSGSTFLSKLSAAILASLFGAVTAWSATDGLPAAGVVANTSYADVDGDGLPDRLVQGRSRVDEKTDKHARIFSAPARRWRNGQLDLQWRDKDYTWIPGDYNGDGTSDLFRQANTVRGSSEVALTRALQPNSEIVQTIDGLHLGIAWDAESHRALAGDFDGDGADDLLLQGRQNLDRHGVMLAAPNGRFERVGQDFDNEYLGLDWSQDKHVTVVGDFDGDGRSDLFLQTTESQPLLPQLANAVLLSSAQGKFDSIQQSFAPDYLGIAWQADNYRIISADFNGGGQDDLFLFSARQSQPSYLLLSEKGQFSRIHAQADIPNLDSLKELLVGDFDGDGVVDLVVTYDDPDLAPQLLFADEQRKKAVASALKANKLLGARDLALLPHSLFQASKSKVKSATKEITQVSERTQSISSLSSEGAPAATGIGALPGKAGVSGGAASYEVPIALPPGRGGMQPSVSLSYSSRAGNGPAGMGWSVNTGASSIQRCPSTVAQDGYNRAVALDAADKLCLDGMRLMAMSGGYGVSGTSYRTELESFVRVTQSGALTGFGNSFLVEYKDGRKAYFTQAQTPTGATTPSSWMLTRLEDLNNNSVIYEYKSYGNGEILLDKIRYTGTGVAAGSRYVEFAYEQRPDSSESYQNGGLLRQTQRLDTVTTFDGSRLVNRYTLGYSTSEATGRSLLAWIQQCSLLEATPTCLPATQFTWDQKKPQFVLERLGYTDGSGFHAIHQDERFLSKAMPHNDTNGDGVIDWPAVNGKPGFYVNAEGKLRGENNTPATNCYRTFKSRSLSCVDVDFNNDGLSDGWRYSTVPDAVGSAQLQVAVNTDGTFGAWQDTGIVMNATDYEADYPQAFVDLNGDGWKDAVVQHRAGTTLTLKAYYHSGAGAPFYAVNRSQVIAQTQLFSLSDGGADAIPTVEVTINDDLDGNGYPDFVMNKVAVSAQSVPVGVPSGLPLAIFFTRVDASHNVSYSSEAIKDLVPNGEKPYRGHHPEPDIKGTLALHQNFNYFMDINGDGLGDWLSLNNGSEGSLYWRTNLGGRFSSWKPLGAEPAGLTHVRVQSYDLSGVVNEVGNAGSGEGEINWQAFERQLRVMDVNGDGKSELLVPGRRVVSSCAGVLSYPTDNSRGGKATGLDTRFFCDDNIYSYYQPTDQNNRKIEIQVQEADSSVYAYDAVHFELNSATGDVESRIETTNLLGSADETAVADVFGKGLPDLVTAIGCRRGVSTNPGSGSTDSNKCFMGDYAGQNKPSDYAINNPAPSRSGDTHLGEGVWVNRNIGSAQPGESYRPVDMLRQVKDGYEREANWTLKPLSTGGYSGATCDNLSATPFYETDFASLNPADASQKGGYFHFASSMYAVAEFTQSNGIGGLNNNTYRYRGAVYNGWGRGFQGFASIIEEQAKPGGIYTRTLNCTNFEQVFPKAGTLKTQLTLAANASQQRPLAQTSLTTAVLRPFGDNASHLTVPLIEDSKTWDVSGSELKHTTVIKNLADYDSYGNVRQAVTVNADALQTNTVTIGSVFEPEIWSWWLDKLGSQRVDAKQSDASGKLIESTKTRTTAYTGYHGNRIPRTIVREPGTGLETVTETVLDGIWGTVAETWLRNGSNTAQAYRLPADRRISKVKLDSTGYFPEAMTNAAGHTATTSYDPATGQILDATDPNQVKTETRYDAFGRPKSVEVLGVSPKKNLSYSGCSALQCSARARYSITTTQSGAPTQTVELDQFERPVRSQVDGFDLDSRVVSDTEYDGYGRTRLQSAPYYWGETAHWTRFTDFDLLDRPAYKYSPADVGPNNAYSELKVAYSYAGLNTAITVGQGAEAFTVSRTYDSLKRVHETRDAGNNATYFRYNGFGEPELIEDSAGNKTTASYNNLGHKLRMSDPDKGTWNFEYNIAGELVKQTDAEGQETSLVTDVLGRVAERWEKPKGGGVAINAATWVYDQALRGDTGAKVLGALTSATKTGETTTSYTYDAYGRPRGTTLTVGAKTWSLDQDYDDKGRPKTTTYPLGDNNPAPVKLEQHYNARGYADQLKNADTQKVYREILGLTERGTLGHFSLGNGLAGRYTYSARTGALASACVANGTDCTMTSQANILGLDYVYDQFGNLKQQDNHVQGVQELFNYDNRMRLRQSERKMTWGGASGYVSAAKVDYLYDALGNLTTKSDFGQFQDYGSAAGTDALTGKAYKPHQVGRVRAADGSVYASYGYDANGNLLQGGANGLTRQLAYDRQNKPTSITRGTEKSVFHYDADGNRYRQDVMKNNVLVKQTYYVGGIYELELDPAAGREERKHYLGDVAVLSQKYKGTVLECNALRFLLKDRLGSVDSVVDGQGVVVERHGFDPFGKPRASNWVGDSTANGLAASLSNPVGLFSKVTTRGFTGHEHVDSVGLIHMGGRAYDPELGRFLSVDPFIQAPTNSQSLNPYSYVMNNPLSGTDPTGYACEAATGSHIASQCSTSIGDIKKVEGFKSGKVIATLKDGSKISLNRDQAAKAIKGTLANGGKLDQSSPSGPQGAASDKSSSKLLSPTTRSNLDVAGTNGGSGDAYRQDPDLDTVKNKVDANEVWKQDGVVQVTDKKSGGKLIRARFRVNATDLSAEEYEQATSEARDYLNKTLDTKKYGKAELDIGFRKVGARDDADLVFQRCPSNGCFDQNGSRAAALGQTGGNVISFDFGVMERGRGTPAHELMHNLGFWHSFNNKNGITSYSEKRSLQPNEVERLIDAYK